MITVFERFRLDFSYDHEQEEYVIDLYDKDNNYVAKAAGSDFQDVLYHVMHLADPVLAAKVIGPAFYDWANDHNAYEFRNTLERKHGR